MSRVTAPPTAAPTAAANTASASSSSSSTSAPVEFNAASAFASGAGAAAIANAQAAAERRFPSTGAAAAASAAASTSASASASASASSLSNASPATRKHATTGAAATTTTAGASASPPLTGADSPLNGLASLLFSGPLQTPLATSEATQQGQWVETAVQNLAPTASPATLASWSSTLNGLTQALNTAEKGATGVDPTAPPQGWTEPANFQAARSLLTSLKGTVAQAQAAQGVVQALAQPAQSAQSASAARAALQAFKPQFMAPEPTGLSTNKLLGAAPAAAEPGKAEAAASGSASRLGRGVGLGDRFDRACGVRPGGLRFTAGHGSGDGRDRRQDPDAAALVA